MTVSSEDGRVLGDIVRDAQRGDAGAFEALVTHFEGMATAVGYARLGNWASAQDAAQEAFIEAYLCLPALRNPAAFPGWFRRIVVKQCDRIYRRARPEVPLDYAHVADDGNNPALIVDARFLSEAVRQAVDQLPHSQRLVAAQYYLLGYSQQEIMNTLALPAGTVKKRLFDARRTLRARMADWEEVVSMQTDDEQVPSTVSKNRVMFFVALHTHDLARVQRLLSESPELVATPFEWDAGPLGHYWPRGYTAMHWAAATDDRPLLDALLTGGAGVDARSSSDRRTPLHVAALMGRPDVAARLIQAGADLHARDDYGHTPLHLAAWANQPAAAAILLRHGATPGILDGGGRSPTEWAVIRNARAVLDLLATPAPPVTPPARPDRSGRILETGLKIIDLFAPLVRGGINGLFSPRSGVGKMVTLNALIHTMATHYGGHTIWLGLDHGLFVRAGLELALRNAGLAHAAHVVTAQQEEPSSFARATDQASDAARERSARGQPVLLVVASPVALADGVMDRLAAVARDAPPGEITVVIYGNETAGAEPTPFERLDAAVSFENGRAQQGLHPSVDVLNSRSILLDLDGAGERHVRLAREARRLLRRHQDLTASPVGDSRGLDGLPVSDDAVVMKRARLFHEFLTQPLPDVELFYQRPAVYVPLQRTLDGCEAILAGRLDSLEEGDLLYTGAVDSGA